MFLSSMILFVALPMAGVAQEGSLSEVTIDQPALSVKVVPIDSISNFQYEIRFSSQSGHTQTLEIRNGIAIRTQDIQFIDLNGDGYKDMMVVGGTDADENKWYKTWIFNPKTQRYIWIGKAIE